MQGENWVATLILGLVRWVLFSLFVTIVFGVSCKGYFESVDAVPMSAGRVAVKPWQVAEKTRPWLATAPVCDARWGPDGTAKCRYRDPDGKFETFWVNKPE